VNQLRRDSRGFGVRKKVKKNCYSGNRLKGSGGDVLWGVQIGDQFVEWEQGRKLS